MHINEAYYYTRKQVYVTIDHPLGSRYSIHSFHYPVIYGYLAHTLAGDGKE